ncbi:Beta-glucosidase 11 [Zea mays]|uniref:beta-glucosidase n=2 Tax=Zea mays TaxID=4577 RepID=A0A1D6PHF5_MAIZE|nr:Beta-glucosidase 11 [Zea mays]
MEPTRLLLLLLVLGVSLQGCIAQGGGGAGGLTRGSFPKGFVFGTASSAYQYEGAVKEDGRGKTIWDKFAHTFGKVADLSNADVAVDQYHRFEEDIQLMADMGMDAYRFSIAWSRILPNGTGQVNQAGVDHYNRFIDALLSKGIEPYVTLYHWDLPQALEDRYNGWLDRQIVYDFAEYAETCFEAFGDRVRHWVTLNEPHTVAVQGYDAGLQAPGRCSLLLHLYCRSGDSATEPYVVAHNFILAHAKVSDVYRKKYKLGGSERRAWDSVRRHVVRADDQHYRRHRGCQERAGVPARMVRGPLLLRRLPGVDEVAGRRQAAQVHGGRGRARQGGARLRRHKPLHHLLHQAQQHRPRGPTAAQHPGGHRNHQPPYVSLSLLRSSTPPSSFSQWTNDGCWFCITAFRNGKAIGDRANSIWLYIVPSGMRSLMNYVKERYNSPPIYVTENGMDDGNSPFTSIKDALKDSKRVKYHNDYLTNLAASIKDDACDVRGYFAWSLLDNWEWTAGYSSRFGLYFVDYKDNLKRYPKSSVQWFKNLLASS